MAADVKARALETVVVTQELFPISPCSQGLSSQNPDVRAPFPEFTEECLKIEQLVFATVCLTVLSTLLRSLCQ